MAVCGLLPLPNQRWFNGVALILALGLTGCDGTADPEDEPAVVAPGTTLPLGTTVRINAGGNYLLPVGATALTTRCWGLVTLTFTRPDGVTQNNSCESDDGGANHTNDVTGVSSVMYELETDGYAHLTAR